MSSLDALFAPQSIAVIGASAAPDKAGFQIMRTLQGFPGRLVPINPRAGDVLGFKAFAALAAIGQPVDLAILTIPAPVCDAALRDAVGAGCRAALIVSGGFGEAGDTGVRLQAALHETIRTSGMRLLGPNTSGVVTTHARVCASFAPGLEELAPGKIAVVAQSGGVNLMLAFMLQHAGHGVSYAIGLGNMVDVDAADCLEYLARDPRTKGIALHLEGVRNGRKLFETLKRVTPIKPVVVLALGRADVGAFAASHTGNLIGQYARKAAALRQAGAVVVESAEALVDGTIALSLGRIAPRPNPGIGIVTGQAGPGLIALDRLRSRDIAVPQLSEATIARIGTLLPPMTYQRNPVDTGRPSPAFADVLDTVAGDPKIDALVVFALHEPAAIDPIGAMKSATAAAAKPFLFGTMGTPTSIAPTLRTLAAQGVAAYASADRLALAAVALAEDALAQHRLRLSEDAHRSAPRGPRISTKIASPLNEAQAKALLGDYGIATPRGIACATHADAHAALQRIGAPVVVKILSTAISHKTEVGGVHVGIHDAAGLDAALARLDAISLSGPRGYLIEAMAPPGLELIVGAVRDPSFGAIVAVGLGGIMAEALQDVAVGLAPLGEIEVLAMLDALQGRALFDGFRGTPAIDRKLVAAVVRAVGHIMADHPEIAEIDLNPVRVLADRALALDALIVLANET